MHRPFSMMIRLQQSFIHQAIAIPFIFFRMNLRKIDRLLYQRLKHTWLRHCLSIHLSDPGAIQRKTNRKITGTPFIRHCITGEVRMIRQSMYYGRITTTRTQHNLSNPMRLEQRNQLEYVLLVCIHDDNY